MKFFLSSFITCFKALGVWGTFGKLTSFVMTIFKQPNLVVINPFRINKFITILVLPHHISSFIVFVKKKNLYKKLVFTILTDKVSSKK